MDELFERLRIEEMVREWCADIHKRPPGSGFVDGLVHVLRLRLRRADPNHKDDSRAARATLEIIAEARGLDPDRPPRKIP